MQTNQVIVLLFKAIRDTKKEKGNSHHRIFSAFFYLLTIIKTNMVNLFILFHKHSF